MQPWVQNRLFGAYKETELARLQYVAIDEAYLRYGTAGFQSTTAGAKNALKAMTNLKEMIVVRDITADGPNRYLAPRADEVLR